MRRGLTWNMLREHRWSYVGLAVVLVASSALVGSSFLLFAAAQEGGLDVSGHTANQTAKMLGLVGNGRFISGLMAALGAFVAVFLVSQTMSFVVEGRRRELALLRLAGASPRQLTNMVLGESVVLGLVCSLIGAALSLPLVGPYADLLSRQSNWPPGFAVSIHFSALVWCVIVMTVVSVAGAFGAARRIGRTPPIDAVRAVTATQKRMPLSRWIFTGIGLIAVVVFMALPAQSVNYQLTTTAVGGGSVLLVSALAPIVVPVIARTLGGALILIAPGAGLVAREHAVHDARRTAALATPIIILLGLGAVFGMMAQTGRSENALGLRELTNTHAVAEFTALQPDHDAFRQAQLLPEVGAITRVQRADDWAWNEPDMPPIDFPKLMGVDPSTFTHFVPAQFEAGSIDDITGLDVAVIAGRAAIGDTLHLEAPNGASVAVHVVAIVDSSSFLYGSFLVDQNTFPLCFGLIKDTWLVEPSHGVSDDQLLAAIDTVGPSAQATTHAIWVAQSVAGTVANQQATILTIIGGAALLAIFSLAQSTLASVRGRRDELELLTRIGARRRSVLASIIVESAITAATAAILAIAVTALVYARMSTALHTLDAALSPIVPIGILALVLTACIATGAVSAAMGASLALNRNKTA